MGACALMLAVLGFGAARADRCEPIRLAEVPADARRSLESAAADGRLEQVCRMRAHGSVSYRARGGGSGITVDVSPTGQVLWRGWSE